VRAALGRLSQEEHGQILAFTALIIVVLLGFVGLVVDVGSWYRSQRQLQSVVDAAALAAAQDLPVTSTAAATANSYVKQNLTENTGASFADTTPCAVGSALSSAPACSINFSGLPSPCTTGTCVQVDASQTPVGIFARVYGAVFNTVTTKATARAAIGTPTLLGKVAPIAVPYNASIECVPASADYPNCFGSAAANWRTLNVSSSITSSGSAVLNLDCHQTSSPPSCNSTTAQQLGKWITHGDQNQLPAGDWYGAVTGQQVGGIGSQGLSQLSKDDVLFLPVYDSCSDSSKTPAAGCRQGNNAYHVLGFSAFAVDSFVWNGKTQTITGYFVTFIASGSIASGSGGEDFGVHVVNLVN
jgi:Flp pilus assembly protein TadG